MSDLLPSFTYPPGDGTGESYVYNYIDIVNVSWSWDGPPGAMIFIVLWLPDSGGTLRDKSNFTVPASANSSFPSALNFNGVQYPATGHFTLYADFPNGSVVQGPDSANALVAKNEAAGWQCYNCSMTATTTSNSATMTVTASGSLMPSSQPNPSSSGGSSSGSSGLSGGPIAGIIVGVAIAVAIASILSVCYWRRRTGGGSSHQTGPTKGAQGTPEEVHRPDQKTEHKGMELHELHDSTQLPEKDSSDEPLMFLAEVGRYE